MLCIGKVHASISWALSSQQYHQKDTKEGSAVSSRHLRCFFWCVCPLRRRDLETVDGDVCASLVDI